MPSKIGEMADKMENHFCDTDHQNSTKQNSLSAGEVIVLKFVANQHDQVWKIGFFHRLSSRRRLMPAIKKPIFPAGKPA
ncbi:hypothetical protein LF934_19765 [Dickeya dadantii]|uniref:hypothetical protein n=1 Tax=Dickeya dadantii TaxID=204038 RepID=UPI001C0BBF7F|nr:hypothetical protein [Dickeya dadantii]MCA7014873.1 hypothetical protein [Dickeya dadantii]QWT40234.1 hypothetical protein KNV89_18105 [Dickeya dadantii]